MRARRRPARSRTTTDDARCASRNRYTCTSRGRSRAQRISPMLGKLLIFVFLVAIVWNLGAGLYYMMTDKGQTDRTVKALTWRIGLSVVLILLVILGIWTGIIEPHGVGG